MKNFRWACQRATPLRSHQRPTERLINSVRSGFSFFRKSALPPIATV